MESRLRYELPMDASSHLKLPPPLSPSTRHWSCRATIRRLLSLYFVFKPNTGVGLPRQDVCLAVQTCSNRMCQVERRRYSMFL